MVYSISDIELNFSNINDELPESVIDLVKETVYETSIVCPEYVIGNHFTDKSKMSLADFGFFFLFRENKIIQSNIENYMSNFKTDIDAFSRTIYQQTKNVY